MSKFPFSLHRQHIQDMHSPEAHALYTIYQASFPERELKDKKLLFSSLGATCATHLGSSLGSSLGSALASSQPQPQGSSQLQSRSQSQQEGLTANCANYLYYAESSEYASRSREPLAAVTIWRWGAETFIEYLAVAPAFRNQKLGAAILQDLQKTTPSLLLEIEVPQDEMSQRRYGFYRRLGFCIQTENYYMPALAQGQTQLPMWLLRWPEKSKHCEDQTLLETIHHSVYSRTSRLTQ